MYCTTLPCTLLHCSVLHCSVLHYTALGVRVVIMAPPVARHWGNGLCAMCYTLNTKYSVSCILSMAISNLAFDTGFASVNLPCGNNDYILGSDVWFSLNQPSVPIQSLSRNVRQSCVCVSMCLCHCSKPASWWIGDFWLKSLLLVLAYLSTFWSICSFNDFLRFYIFSG